MNLLENLSNDILQLVQELETILKNIDKNIISTKRNGQNRTIKQIVGHLGYPNKITKHTNPQNLS